MTREEAIKDVMSWVGSDVEVKDMPDMCMVYTETESGKIVSQPYDGFNRRDIEDAIRDRIHSCSVYSLCNIYAKYMWYHVSEKELGHRYYSLDDCK
jgi:hypothetical protein